MKSFWGSWFMVHSSCRVVHRSDLREAEYVSRNTLPAPSTKTVQLREQVGKGLGHESSSQCGTGIVPLGAVTQLTTATGGKCHRQAIGDLEALLSISRSTISQKAPSKRRVCGMHVLDCWKNPEGLMEAKLPVVCCRG